MLSIGIGRKNALLNNIKIQAKFGTNIVKKEIVEGCRRDVSCAVGHIQ